MKRSMKTISKFDCGWLDLASGEVKVIHPGWDDETEVVFSPDGTLIALAEHDQDFNKDIWILAADGSKEMTSFLKTVDDPEAFVDIAAFSLCEDAQLKQKLLETLDVRRRLELFGVRLRREIEDLKLRRKLQGSLPDERISEN